MKICIIGLGYIGLPTAAMFSINGCNVIGVDTNVKIINSIINGSIDIYEPGLKEIIESSITEGNFKAQVNPEKADVFIITVPTPIKDDKYLSCDLSYVIQACKNIIPYIQKENTVIIESTMAPKSIDDYIRPLFEKFGFTVGKDLYLAYCPERVLPGNILFELENNNRIIGGTTSICADKAANIYRIFVKGEIIKTEAKIAEMAKCMENTFRDVNIALANELTQICCELNINCLDVIKMANKHPRVNILSPGPGVGGHCLAVDPYFIYSKTPDIAKIIKTCRDVNSSMIYFVCDKIEKILKENKTSTITIFGIAYKGNTDDTRESPGLKLIDLLRKKGYNNIRIYDPYVIKDAKLDESINGSELIVILTDHDEFKNINYDNLFKGMKLPIIFDTKNIIDSIKYKHIKIFNYGNIMAL